MNEIILIIEGKPFTQNKQFITRKGSRKIRLSEEAKGYGDSIGWQAKEQFGRRPLLTGDLEVTYLYYFKYIGKNDHLNYNKLLNDRLNQIVWQDDRQIKISHHYTMADKASQRIILIIKPISDYAKRIEKEVEVQKMSEVRNFDCLRKMHVVRQ